MSECDDQVFQQGNCLCTPTYAMRSMSSAEVEKLTTMLSDAAKERNLALKFDWHFQGGLPMILYLGDYNQAVELCYQVRSLICNLVTDAVQDPNLDPLPFVGKSMFSFGQQLHKRREKTTETASVSPVQ